MCLFCLLPVQTLQAENSQQTYQIEEYVDGLTYPWALAFLSDSQFLVTERGGTLRHVVNRTVSQPVEGIPKDIYVKGQGGLLDVILHPDYQTNRWIYLSYAAGNDQRNHLSVFRARLVDNQLVDTQTVFSVSPDKDTPVHFGGRLAFLPDNTLLISTGDGFDYREDAQRLNNLLGKIVRINDDGSVPDDNPFIDQTDNTLSRFVFSLGHRNPQGLVYDANRNLVFEHEHGPAGGDEINIIQAGMNYGWPIITYGKDYSGARISPFTEYPGLQQPLVNWTPSIAPSGMAIYQGKMFPHMQGDLLVSTLKATEVRWIQLSGVEVTGQTSLFKELGYRIRDIKVHPDGSILLLIDSEQGKILRVTPKPQ